MKATAAAEAFTDHLLDTIREQRHNATRIIIATQEPTISPRLLDLCSMTIVHRFTSPDWLGTIKGHFAGASALTNTAEDTAELFRKITDLGVGESLLFSTEALLRVGGECEARKLGAGFVRFKTRTILGDDGGRSRLAIR